MTTPLWRWPDLCAALDKPETAGPDVTGISIDTRTLRPGDLFVAIVAERDGHEFLEAAKAAGAAGALVRRGTQIDLPTLEVEDTLDGLVALGAAGRARVDASIVAITGSAGKTTARQWLESILSAQTNAHASVGSLNNYLGVPISLARMPADTRVGVFEIGTNHEGEIAPLSRQVAPDVSMVLNVLPAHIGNFPGFDALRREKLSIEAGLKDRGTLIVPMKLDLSGALTRNVLTFGQSRKANIYGKARYANGGADVTVRIGGLSWEYRLEASGEHRMLTSLAVFGALFAIDADMDAAIARFPQLSVPEGRGNTIQAGGATLIDDSYNANPVSMRYALEALALEEGQRVAILGEMLELGDDTQQHHASIEEACAGLDGVITVGEGFDDWGESLGSRHWGHYPTVAELDIDSLAARLEDATVLVKGSNKVFWVHGFVNRLAEALVT